MKKSLLALFPALLVSGCAGDVNESIDESHAFIAEAWADNWFSMHIGDSLIVEDSVSIDTERSFNAERWTFDASPGAVLSFTLKDYKADDSGLEYIGETNQQMGDGGFIAQIMNQSTGEVVLVSDGAWRCLVTHDAPLDKSCESSSSPGEDCEFATTPEPNGWRDQDFDDTGWSTATVHSATDVGPKDGYDAITWDSSAELIWGTDLESNNTLLCRTKLP